MPRAWACRSRGFVCEESVIDARFGNFRDALQGAWRSSVRLISAAQELSDIVVDDAKLRKLFQAIHYRPQDGA
jgi:hypothetical protein